MRVMHIITGLGQGGAEAALYRLCKACSDDSHTVVSLRGEEVFSGRLRSIGVDVYHLDIQSWWDAVFKLPALWRLLIRRRPDAVQTWMYHADLYGGVAARLAGIRNVCWGLRHGVVVGAITKTGTRWAIRLGALLSRALPRAVVSCSVVGADNHIALGYAANRMTIIPNGLELDAFMPQVCRTPLAELGCRADPSLPVLGMVARYDPYKDHKNLIEALSILRVKGRAFHCLLIGEGLNESNTELVAALSNRGLLPAVSLLGRREDVPAVMNALDLSVLSSQGEAFPNVLAEAMACGVPCVTTDAGDAATIVGDTGWIVRCHSPQDLARALEQALIEWGSEPQDWARRKLLCRERVQRDYSLERMAQAYRALWARGVNTACQGHAPGEAE